MKKLDALELDIDNFHNNIGELAALSQGLITRGHFDNKKIQQQQIATEDRFRELQDLVAQRRSRLQEAKKLYEFHREADEVTTWIREKESIAGSEDYGTDLEHVQVKHSSVVCLCVGVCVWVSVCLSLCVGVCV